MLNRKPVIKFNSGNPVALCLKCSVIMCYIDVSEGKNEVYRTNSSSIDELKEGDKIPLYCKDCLVKELIIEKT